MLHRWRWVPYMSISNVRRRYGSGFRREKERSCTGEMVVPVTLKVDGWVEMGRISMRTR